MATSAYVTNEVKSYIGNEGSRNCFQILLTGLKYVDLFKL